MLVEGNNDPSASASRSRDEPKVSDIQLWDRTWTCCSGFPELGCHLTNGTIEMRRAEGLEGQVKRMYKCQAIRCNSQRTVDASNVAPHYDSRWSNPQETIWLLLGYRSAYGFDESP